MKKILDWHKNYSLRNADYFKDKLNISDYGILWIAFSGSAFLGLLIMVSKIAGGNEIQQNNLLIQLGACALFPILFFLDRNKED